MEESNDSQNTSLLNSPQPARWKFYTKTRTAWEAMLTQCESATVSIDLEQFIFLNDQVGQKFIDVCRRKAKEGVKVRLLCDAAGSFNLFNTPALTEIKNDGVEVVFFNTFIPGAFHNHSLWFFRDHRKLLIVDKKVGFTGGICFSEEMKGWRDTHVEIEGEVVKEMDHAFESMWRRAHKRRYNAKKPQVGIQGFNYTTNSPLPRKRFLYHRLVDAIRTSKKYVYLTTPYFVPDGRFLRVLKLARRRGVEVNIIVPEHSDHKIVDIGSHTFFHTLLSAGVSIYQYKGTMIHSKTAIIDDEWSTVGSMNLDNVSFLYNFEANLISRDKEFAAELKSHFIEDIENSTLLTLETWNKRPIRQKITELLVYPIRNFL